MKRYDFDELTKHECADGEWVKASEAEAEIKSLRLLLSDCLDCFEHTPTRPIAVSIRKALEKK